MSLDSRRGLYLQCRTSGNSVQYRSRWSSAAKSRGGLLTTRSVGARYMSDVATARASNKQVSRSRSTQTVDALQSSITPITRRMINAYLSKR